MGHGDPKILNNWTMTAVTDKGIITSEPHRVICNYDIQNMTRYARQYGQEIKQEKNIY